MSTLLCFLLSIQYGILLYTILGHTHIYTHIYMCQRYLTSQALGLGPEHTRVKVVGKLKTNFYEGKIV